MSNKGHVILITGRLMALAVFAFASTAPATGFLFLESSPGGAEVWYTGPENPDRKFLGDTPLESRELPAGRYQLWLILPGQDTLAVPDVYVREGKATRLNREIPMQYGHFEVIADPDGSDLRLDGVQIGAAPHVNDLMLPGRYRLKVAPKESHFLSSSRSLTIGKRDSLLVSIRSPYRDKALLQENLSLPAWRLQLETGSQYRFQSGIFDTAGQRISFKRELTRSQWDFPARLRLGLPSDLEIHMLLPFKTHQEKGRPSIFPGNFLAGVKYVYRPADIGLDLSYGLGFKNVLEALGHDFLSITLMGMLSKGKITGAAQAGFEFHFASRGDNNINPGDQALAHARMGYLLDPFLPYVGLSGRLHLGDRYDEKPSEGTGGYSLVPEPGIIVDVDDLISFQLGFPFVMMGKNIESYWGTHFSFSLGLNLKK